jgi:hypothetical protein
MQVQEVISKPPTPEQQRILSLKSPKDRAADALDAERQRQKIAKAQKAMTAAQQITNTSNAAIVP